MSLSNGRRESTVSVSFGVGIPRGRDCRNIHQREDTLKRTEEVQFCKTVLEV